MGGLFIFAAHRTARHRIQNHNKNRSSSSSYQFDSHNVKKDSKKASIVYGAALLACDVIISAISSISIYYGDWDQNIITAADTPLVAGRSMLSDSYCKELVQLYSSIPKRTWDKHQGSLVEWDSLSTMCHNCIRRQMMEKDMRSKQSSSLDFWNVSEFGSDNASFGGVVEGEKEDSHVAIPMPGVPKDLPIHISWGDGSEDITVGDEVQENDFGMGDEANFHN